MLIDDPSADARSEMMRKPAICNGKANGVPCRYYWLHIAKVESNNPDILRQGEFHRACLISPGFPVEFSEETIPHTCNQYVPRREGWRNGFRKAKYNPIEEKYNPLTPEEYKANLEGDPEFTKHVEDMKKSLPIINQNPKLPEQHTASKQDLDSFFDSNAIANNEDKE